MRNEDIFRAYLLEPIHDRSDATLIYHGRDGDPAFLLQLRDGGRALSRRDLRCHGQFVARDVVGAKHVLFGHDDTADARLDGFHEGRVGWVFGLY